MIISSEVNEDATDGGDEEKAADETVSSADAAVNAPRPAAVETKSEVIPQTNYTQNVGGDYSSPNRGRGFQRGGRGGGHGGGRGSPRGGRGRARARGRK